MEYVQFEAAEHARRSLWDKVHLTLYLLSYRRHLEEPKKSPDIKLHLAIIMKAAHDRHAAFFNTFMFSYLCDLLELEPQFVLKYIKKTWEHYDMLQVRRIKRKQ